VKGSSIRFFLPVSLVPLWSLNVRTYICLVYFSNKFWWWLIVISMEKKNTSIILFIALQLASSGFLVCFVRFLLVNSDAGRKNVYIYMSQQSIASPRLSFSRIPLGLSENREQPVIYHRICSCTVRTQTRGRALTFNCLKRFRSTRRRLIASVA
jgi:hypothetical protein